MKVEVFDSENARNKEKAEPLFVGTMISQGSYQHNSTQPLHTTLIVESPTGALHEVAVCCCKVVKPKASTKVAVTKQK